MKKILYILLLFIGISTYGQNVSQTYYDKCTGETKVFTVASQGSTVVIYYNQFIRVTAAEVQAGVLRAWLETTYQWWITYNPCPVAQAVQQQVVQQTASQVTQAATAAATSAASAAASAAAAPPPMPPSAPEPVAASPSAAAPTTETKSESKTETKTETKSEEKKEESKSETKKDDKKEEEKKEDKKEQKKEDKKEEKKKQQVINPIMLAANMMTTPNPDGTFTQAASFGLSQSSLTGETSYGANAMIWSNLKQFSVSLSKTTILFNYDRKIALKIKGIEYGSYYGKGSINKISGINVTAMLMGTTKVISAGVSDVFLLKKKLVVGYASGTTLILIENNLIVSPSLTIFATKPFPFKRYTVSPMVATSFSPIGYTTLTNEFSFNKYFTYIIGSNFDLNLTKRFKANIGGNVVANTNVNVPLTYSITIGSKIQL